MKSLKFLVLFLILQMSFLSNAYARDFSWLDDLAVEARVDGSGVRARIAARFHLGDAKLGAIIDDVGGHAHAYMVLRLAEISHLPVDVVVSRYHETRGQGWGVLAKRLGIKPGSQEFHALKRGHDLHIDGSSRGKDSRNKSKSKGNGKQKDNHGGGKGKGKN